jgi:hypothetical protein
MKIIFNEDYTPKGQAADRPSYVAGKTYSFPDAVGQTYARKYVGQGLAKEVGNAPVREPVAEIPMPDGRIPVEAEKLEEPAREPEKKDPAPNRVGRPPKSAS